MLLRISQWRIKDHVVLKRYVCLKMLIFLYFDIYIFLVFLNYLKVCVTRRERSDRHEKERKTIFGIFENECHAVRTTRLTQKEKEIIFSIFELFERKCHTTRAVGQTLK